MEFRAILDAHFCSDRIYSHTNFTYYFFLHSVHSKMKCNIFLYFLRKKTPSSSTATDEKIRQGFKWVFYCLLEEKWLKHFLEKLTPRYSNIRKTITRRRDVITTQDHGKITTRSWKDQGKTMERSRQDHEKITRSWEDQAMKMTRSWEDQSKSMTRSRQDHEKVMTRSWQDQAMKMTRLWEDQSKSMTRSRQDHEKIMTRSW